MKTWLKGGLIGGIIGFILIIFDFNSFRINTAFYEFIRYGTCYGQYCDLDIFIGGPFRLISGFIIGALIGWIIGKIKQK